MAGADVLATLQAAQRAAEEGQVEAAIAGFEAIAPAATTNAALHYQLALLHFRAGDATKAREAVDRALRIAPDVPSFHVTRARILKDLGDESGAEAALRRALQLKPGLGRTVGEGRS
ncbi:MAG: tetratricopeptide repeat protein [Alphaproteobacteria bacterium]|nr:tetratricopeptide repeat protein [Alphaproteobacteria bacterium]